MSTALATIETVNAVDLFNPSIIDPILAKIRAEVLTQAEPLDISTEENRKALAALAYKVGRSKTFIDNQRVGLVSAEKKRLKLIDQEGARIWDNLEALQKEVRKPLTDWEQLDKDRVAAHEAALAEIGQAGIFTSQNWTILTAEAMQDRLNEIEDDIRNWQEFAERAKSAKLIATVAIQQSIDKRKAADAEQAELDRLRAESAARDQKDREERIAREATERAEAAAREREDKAQRDAAEAVARQQRETEAAEARAATAEANARAAAERAERDKVAAVEAERQRQADAKAAEEAATKAREKDKAHKAEWNNLAMIALVEKAGLTTEAAKKAVTAIVKGDIPNVWMVY